MAPHGTDIMEIDNDDEEFITQENMRAINLINDDDYEDGTATVYLNYDDEIDRSDYGRFIERNNYRYATEFSFNPNLNKWVVEIVIDDLDDPNFIEWQND